MSATTKALWYAFALTLCCGAFLTTIFITEGRTHGLLTVDVFDIGQGDGIMIQTPYGQQVIVDGGPGRTMEDKVAATMPLFDHKIEMIIISHPHADHINGLLGIMKKYEVDRLVWSGVDYDSKLFDALRQEIEAQHIPTQIVRGGDTITFGPEVKMEIIAPVGDVVDKTFKEVHEGTVVGRLVYKNSEMLLTGDVNEEIEDAILATHRPIDADILKVSHHGSKYSTTDAFLDAVSPDYAVISVGKDNRYGHPHAELLDRVQKRGIPLYRTDEQGDVRITTNGEHITISHK